MIKLAEALDVSFVGTAYVRDASAKRGYRRIWGGISIPRTWPLDAIIDTNWPAHLKAMAAEVSCFEGAIKLRDDQRASAQPCARVESRPNSDRWLPFRGFWLGRNAPRAQRS